MKWKISNADPAENEGMRVERDITSINTTSSGNVTRSRIERRKYEKRTNRKNNVYG